MARPGSTYGRRRCCFGSRRAARGPGRPRELRVAGDLEGAVLDAEGPPEGHGLDAERRARVRDDADQEPLEVARGVARAEGPRAARLLVAVEPRDGDAAVDGPRGRDDARAPERREGRARGDGRVQAHALERDAADALPDALRGEGVAGDELAGLVLEDAAELRRAREHDVHAAEPRVQSAPRRRREEEQLRRRPRGVGLPGAGPRRVEVRQAAGLGRERDGRRALGQLDGRRRGDDLARFLRREGLPRRRRADDGVGRRGAAQAVDDVADGPRRDDDDGDARRAAEPVDEVAAELLAEEPRVRAGLGRRDAAQRGRRRRELVGQLLRLLLQGGVGQREERALVCYRAGGGAQGEHICFFWSRWSC